MVIMDLRTVDAIIFLCTIASTVMIRTVVVQADVYSSIHLSSRGTFATDVDACRHRCSERNAFLAWVHNASEQLYIQTNFATQDVHYLLGGMRDPNNLTLFRWTEGPPGAADGGLGEKFFFNGACLTYCNFAPQEPNSVTETAVEMVNGLWNDRAAAVNYQMTQHCLCRGGGVIATGTTSHSVEATVSRTASRPLSSQTMTVSRTASRPPGSQTMTVSRTASRPLGSQTMTVSRQLGSQTMTVSRTASRPPGSQTMTVSRTASRPPGSQTMTVSRTASRPPGSQTMTVSRTASRPLSSQTMTVPASGTVTTSVSISASRTVNASETASLTGSVAHSRGTLSRSATYTVTQSLSVNPTASHSVAPSATTSKSPTTGHRTASGSTTPTSTGTTSRSAAASVTRTTSNCHYVTGDNAATVVAFLYYDNTTVSPTRPQNSPWGLNGSTTFAGRGNRTVGVGDDVSDNDSSAMALEFRTTKSSALRSGGGKPVVLVMVLLPELSMHPSFSGATIDSTFGASARVLGSRLGQAAGGINAIELSYQPIGNQFLAQEQTLWIPLRIIAGACVNVSAPRLPVVLRMTRATPAMMDIASSIVTNAMPIAAISSPTAAVGMARLSILRSLVECNVDLDDDDGNGLLGLAIGPVRGQYMRGAVVGNIALVIGMGCLVLLVTAIGAWYGWLRYGIGPRRSVAALCNVLHVPGIFMPLIVAVLQPTLASAIQLMVLVPVPGDRLVGAMALAVVVLGMVVPFTIVMCRQFCLVLAPRRTADLHKTRAAVDGAVRYLTTWCAGLTKTVAPATAAPAAVTQEEADASAEELPTLPLDDGGHHGDPLGCGPNAGTTADDSSVLPDGDESCSPRSRPSCEAHVDGPTKEAGATSPLDVTTYEHRMRGAVVKACMFLFVAQRHWVPADGTGAHGLQWKQRYHAVTMDSCTWWFPVVDMWLAVLVGVVGGLSLGNETVCRGQLGVMLWVHLVAACLQLVVVTALIPVSRAYAAGMQVLGLAACCGIVVVTIQDENETTPALVFATSALLAIAALSAMKGFVDVVGMLAAIPRVVRSSERALSILAPVALDQQGSGSESTTSSDLLGCPNECHVPTAEGGGSADRNEVLDDCSNDGNASDLDALMDEFQWVEVDHTTPTPTPTVVQQTDTGATKDDAFLVLLNGMFARERIGVGDDHVDGAHDDGPSATNSNNDNFDASFASIFGSGSFTCY